MAPKRKSTPSYNPLRSGASSSSNPTPYSIQFHDDEAQKDFSENFCKRGIHSKRHVILSDFSNTDLPIVIHSKGRESLCGVSVTSPSVIIQEFYSNMHGIDTSIPYFFSCVQGTRIVVTLEIVSEEELLSRFYKTPSSWGDHQNTLNRALQKVRGSLTW